MKKSVAPAGAWDFGLSLTHGLRRGLPSVAAAAAWFAAHAYWAKTSHGRLNTYEGGTTN